MAGPASAARGYCRNSEHQAANHSAITFDRTSWGRQAANSVKLPIIADGYSKNFHCLERDQWAREREAWLWKQFQSDRARLIELSRSKKTLEALAGDEEAQKLVLRWVSNYGKAPEGWPYEVGYWIGRRIVEAYIGQAPDRKAALNGIIELEDAEAIIVQSKYGASF